MFDCALRKLRFQANFILISGCFILMFKETFLCVVENMEIFNMNTSSLAQLEAEQSVSASVKNLKNISPITSRYQYVPQNNNNSSERNINQRYQSYNKTSLETMQSQISKMNKVISSLNQSKAASTKPFKPKSQNPRGLHRKASDYSENQYFHNDAHEKSKIKINHKTERLHSIKNVNKVNLYSSKDTKQDTAAKQYVLSNTAFMDARASNNPKYTKSSANLNSQRPTAAYNDGFTAINGPKVVKTQRNK